MSIRNIPVCGAQTIEHMGDTFPAQPRLIQDRAEATPKEFTEDFAGQLYFAWRYSTIPTLMDVYYFGLESVSGS